MHQVLGVAEHELGAIVGVVEQRLYFAGQPVEGAVAGLPPQDDETHQQLNTHPPEYWPPADLSTRNQHESATSSGLLTAQIPQSRTKES